jgi:hypothetical protein
VRLSFDAGSPLASRGKDRGWGQGRIEMGILSPRSVHLILPFKGRTEEGMGLLTLPVADWGLDIFNLSFPRRRECRIAGGSPAAGYFLLRGQKTSSQRKGRPWRAALTRSLCYSTSRAAVELALDMNEHVERARAQTSPRRIPPARPCYSPAHKGSQLRAVSRSEWCREEVRWVLTSSFTFTRHAYFVTFTPSTYPAISSAA